MIDNVSIKKFLTEYSMTKDNTEIAKRLNWSLGKTISVYNECLTKQYIVDNNLSEYAILMIMVEEESKYE